MKTKFKTFHFFLSQVKKNYKKSLIVIVIFGISFSLLAGFTYGVDSIEQSLTNNLQSEGIPQISDMSFVFIDERLVASPYADSLEAEVYDRISPISNSFRFATQWGEGVQFHKTDLNFSKYGINQKVENYFSPFLTVMGDGSFYNSSRLYDLIHIIDGEIPTTEYEIMVDIAFAQTNNYSVGDSVLLDYEIFLSYAGFVPKNSSFHYKIAGIYAPLNQDIQLGFSEYNFDYEYDFENETIHLLNRQPQFFGSGSIVQSSPIFGFIDFEELLFNPLFLELEQSVSRYDILNWFSTGVAINLDFDQVEFTQIEQYISGLNQSIHIIMESRENRVLFHSYFLSNLQNLKTTFQRARILIPLLNIPLLFFAIIMGSMAIKNDLYNRMEEFLLLRSKGTSLKLIRNEMLFEAIIQGFLSASIGAFLGVPIFYGIRNLMDQVFLGIDLTSINYLLKVDSILFMFGIGSVAAIIASVSSIVYISRLPISKIINKLKQNTIDGSIDFEDIYPDESQFELRYKKENLNTSTIINTKKNLSKRDMRALKQDKMKKKRKLQKIYKISNRNFDFKKNIFSLLYLACAIIPIIIITIGSWGQSPTSPDLIYNFYENNKNFFSLGIIFVLLTPFFLTLSIIRFIGVERAPILARISRRFAQPFIGNLSKLLGIEHIRRRQYLTLTSVIGVFISLIVFINIFLTSNLNIPYVEDNLRSGADVNIQYSTSILGVDPYLTHGNVTSLENELLQLKDSRNNLIVDDVLTLYLGVPLEEMLPGFTNPITGVPALVSESSFTYFMIYTNISKLSQFLYENGKFDYTDSQSLLENFATNQTSSDIPNCIVSDRYLFSTGKSKGDLIQIPHGYQNETLDVINDPIDAKILGSSNNIPGLWLKSIGTSLEESYNVIPFDFTTSLTLFTLLDISVLNNVQYNLNNYTIATMLDLNDNIPLNLDLRDDITGKIQNISLHYQWVSLPNFYIDSYQEYLSTSLEQTEIFLVNYGFLLEFGGIGIIIALSISVLSVSLFKNNIFFNHLMKSKGIGQSGLFKFFLVLLFNIFAIGLIIGGLIGWISGILLFRSQFFIRTFVPFQSRIPLSIDFISMAVIISIIPITVLIFNIISNKMVTNESKKVYQRDF